MTERVDATVRRFAVAAVGLVFTLVFLTALRAIIYGTMTGDQVWTTAGAAMLVLTAGAATYLKRKLKKAARPSGQED